MVERGGRIVAGPVPDTGQFTLEPIIVENIERGSTVSTDEYPTYRDLGRGGYYDHGTTNHKREEYVRGIHHTNTIEGHWGHFKRAIRGTHVSVSGKHMWKYVNEFSYRRNFRKSHAEMFNRLVAAFSQPRLAEP